MRRTIWTCAYENRNNISRGHFRTWGDRRWVGWFQGFDYCPWAREHRGVFFWKERVEQNDGGGRRQLKRRQTAVAGNDE